MGCHAGTGGDPSGDNGVLGFRDPVTGTEQIGDVVSIVQDSQARLGISMEITAFSQPFYNLSNVLDSMRVSTERVHLRVGEAARGLHVMPFVPHSHNRQSQFQLQTSAV